MEYLFTLDGSQQQGQHVNGTLVCSVAVACSLEVFCCDGQIVTDESSEVVSFDWLKEGNSSLSKHPSSSVKPGEDTVVEWACVVANSRGIYL